MPKGLLVLLLLIAAAIALTWWQTRAVVQQPLTLPAAEPRPDAPPAPEPPSRRPSTVAGVPPPVAEAGDEPLEFSVTSEGDLLFVLRSLGMEDLEARMTQWALARGYPEYDQAGNYLLDQPYQQYDDDTLRALAEGDDMWAQQILAQRLAKQDPEEAMEWYRRAAANGSVYAMQELARLYQRSDRKTSRTVQAGNRALTQSEEATDAVSPSVTAYAWLATAEKSGWDPTRALSLVSLVGRKLSDEEIAEACKLSETLQSGLAAERAARGRDPVSSEPPPLVFAPGDMGGGTQCYDEGQAGYDMSGCREAIVHTGNTSTSVWICGQ